MVLQLKSPGGGQRVRSRQGFQALRRGDGGDLAALGNTLGVVLDAAPGIIDKESKLAWDEGMRARIDGVERENVENTSGTMLGFMFSKQSMDGFDYQDAMMDAPFTAAVEKMTLAEQLKDATSPEQVMAAVAASDMRIKEMIGSRPDVYRFAMSQEMLKMRAQAITSGVAQVQRNRERARGSAASAGAKAAAENISIGMAGDLDSIFGAPVQGETYIGAPEAVAPLAPAFNPEAQAPIFAPETAIPPQIQALIDSMNS